MKAGTHWLNVGETGCQAVKTESLCVVVVVFRDSTVKADLKMRYENFKAGLKQTKEGVRVLHEVVDVPNQSDFEEQAMAEQHTLYDVLVLLGRAQDLLPQTSGLPSFRIIGQNFRVHAEHLPREPAISKPPAVFARRVMDCLSLDAATRASEDAGCPPNKGRLVRVV